MFGLVAEAEELPCEEAGREDTGEDETGLDDETACDEVICDDTGADEGACCEDTDGADSACEEVLPCPADTTGASEELGVLEKMMFDEDEWTAVDVVAAEEALDVIDSAEKPSLLEDERSSHAVNCDMIQKINPANAKATITVKKR